MDSDDIGSIGTTSFADKTKIKLLENVEYPYYIRARKGFLYKTQNIDDKKLMNSLYQNMKLLYNKRHHNAKSKVPETYIC